MTTKRCHCQAARDASGGRGALVARRTIWQRRWLACSDLGKLDLLANPARAIPIERRLQCCLWRHKGAIVFPNHRKCWFCHFVQIHSQS